MFKEIANEVLPTSKIIVVVSLLMGFIQILAQCTERLIWEKAEVYFLVMALVLIDFATGVILAIKRNDFQTRRLPKVIYTLIAYSLLMMIAYNLAKHDKIYFWLPEFVFVIFTSSKLLSIIKNLALMGYIPRILATYFIEKIDTFKNKFLEKQDEPNENKISKLTDSFELPDNNPQNDLGRPTNNNSDTNSKPAN